MVTFYARNELTHFKIIFTGKNKSNIEHVDYIFAIKDKIGNLIAPNTKYPYSFKIGNGNDQI